MLPPHVLATLDGWLDGEVPNDAAAPPTGPTATARVQVPAPNADAGQARPPANDRISAPFGVRVSAALLGGGGMLPSPALGVEVGVATELVEGLPLSLAAQGFIPVARSFEDDPFGAVSFYLARVVALMCPRSRYSGIEVDGCAGFDAGVMYARSRGYLLNDTLTQPAFDLVLQSNLRVRFSELVALRLGASFGVPVVSQSFETRNSAGFRRELFGVSPVTLLFHIGLGFTL
jgi:hypothetical protein